MSVSLLNPIEEEELIGFSLLPKQILGKNIFRHTHASGLPDLKDIDIAIIGLNEQRNSFYANTSYDLTKFRAQFYELYPGNWNLKIADLGDLPNGETVEDSYFAIKEIAIELKQWNVIPIFIGGSHDIIYALYQSYQTLKQFVNIVSVDRSLDFSQEEELISGRSYMSKIILEQPNVLCNYTNLGFQSYYYAQEEKDLMEKLFFDGLRLGTVLSHPELTEPYLRDADIVGIDMKSLSWQAVADPLKGSPNGIDSRTICSLARYAGISDRVAYFGLFDLPTTPVFHQLLAQMVWYFIEGVHLRFGEYPLSLGEGFVKYTVALSDQSIIFYKSELSQRWWMEITNESAINNKMKSSTLLPCTQQDYNDAMQDKIPERWYNAIKRM